MLIGVSELKRMASIVGQVVPKGAIIESHEEILFQATGGIVTVSASNSFGTISVVLESEAKADSEFCVRYDLLSKLVSFLPESPVSFVPLKDGGASLSCPTGKHKIPGQAVKGWSRVMPETEMIEAARINPAHLRHASRFSQRDPQRNTNDVIICGDSSKTHIHATDGHKYARFTSATDDAVPGSAPFEIRINREECAIIGGTWSEIESFRVGKSRATISGGGVTYTFLLSNKDGFMTSLPDTLRDRVSESFTVDKNQLISCIRRVSIHDAHSNVTIGLVGETLSVTAPNAVETITINHDGPDRSVIVDGAMVIAAMGAIKEDNPTVGLSRLSYKNKDGNDVEGGFAMVADVPEEGIVIIMMTQQA